MDATDANGTFVVLFDGECSLCTASVQFIIARDPGARIRFASLQSPAGQRLLHKNDVATPPDGSVVLVEGDRHYIESDAALRICRRLTFPWPILAAALLMPRAIRNAVYRFIARRRYRWFGQPKECLVPSPELRKRFIE